LFPIGQCGCAGAVVSEEGFLPGWLNIVSMSLGLVHAA